jgi:hypothetical protein
MHITKKTLLTSNSVKNTPLPSGICAVDFRHRTRSDSFVSTSTASCKVVANFTTHVQIALLLSWLCAAVRSSDHAGLSLSSVSVDGGLKTNVGRSLSIGIAPLEHVKSDGTCWHELFHHGIIAKDFPIPSRSFGRGLEIPFSDMALLCGCLGFVEYKSGFVVDGLTSILIPRKKLLEGEDDAFQWHFESKIRDEGRIAYTTDVLEKVDMEPWGNGNSDVLRDDLINKRCFLAWAERCTIMVGTEKHFNSTTIDDSHAKVSASTKHVRAYGLNLGGNVSHLPFGATMNLTPTSMPAFFKPSISNGIRDILTIEKTQNKGNHFVLVYDTEAKIGWYLPQACVVLYMVHHYLSEQRLDLIDAENQETSLEFAEQDGFTNVGPRAASILYKNLGCRTQRCLMSNPTRAKQAGMLSASSSITSTSTIYEHCQFKDTIERLWYLLDTVGSTLKTNQSEYMKCSESTPHGLHGVDFKELLAAKGPERFTSIRYVKIEQPWSYLTNDQSTVLFCKNFGQAIVPASKGLCEVWSKVPQKEGFLAMTGRTIHYFLEKHQSGLSKELKWLSKKPLIQGHHLPEHSSVVHTQLLKEKGGASLAKIKDKISRTTSGGDLSNDQLIEAISPQSCLLFAVQQGKQCTSPAINAGCEEILKPADAIEAPAFLASIHSNLRNQQEKYNRDSTVVEHANLKLISIRKKHASVSSSESSGSKDFSLANRDSGHQPRQESTKDYSYGLGARGRLGEDEFRDETQEQSKPLMPLHPQPPHTFLTLGLDSLKDGDQPSFTLEQQRDPMQEHDEQNSQSPNFISESGPRSNGVTSSGS